MAEVETPYVGGPLGMEDERGAPVVYYARSGNQIKIGYTAQMPARRMSMIQTDLGEPLELLAAEPGAQALERQRHEEFVAYHLHGEWFFAHEQLLDHIAAVAARHPLPVYESRIDGRDQRRANMAQRQQRSAGGGLTYKVIVTREDGAWLADVPELEGTHTYARNLPGLDTSVREVIALAEDLPEGAEAGLKLTYEYHTGDQRIDQVTAELRATRERLRIEERRLTEQTAEVARELVSSHSMSVRDVAALIGTSAQRISQVAPTRRPVPRPAPKGWAVKVVGRRQTSSVSQDKGWSDERHSSRRGS